MNKLIKNMNKKTVTVLSTVALLATGATVGAIGYVNSNNQQSAPASANPQGTRVWLQYGTLKYDLKGPSGKVYRAGTKVVRFSYRTDHPDTSMPGAPFYLTVAIGGTPGMNMIQDGGGGKIDERYVNMGEWNETDYPSESTTLVNNTMDDQDLSSADFHPVDPNNFDIPAVNRDALKDIYSDFIIDINWNHNITKDDAKLRDEINKRYGNAEGMAATQAEIDQLTSDIKKALAQYKKTGHISGALDNTEAPTKPDTSKPSTGSGNTDTTKPTPTAPSKARYVKLRKASYLYTRKGKRVSKKLLKKGTIVRINGKVYRIKGKTFYRIAKNRYVRVVNVAK